LFIQHIKTAERSWFRWECRHLQYARTICFNCSDWRHKRVCLFHNRLLFLFLNSRWCEIFAIIVFVIFVTEEIYSLSVCKEGIWKNFENHWSGPVVLNLG